MLSSRETLRKSERLCSRKSIEALFANGRSFYCNPVLIVWSYADPGITPPAQVAFSVPKKIFKTAVTRNLLKRRMREAYRKNKTALYDHLNAAEKKIVFTMIYKEKYVSDYSAIEKAVKQMIDFFVNTTVK